MKKKFVCNNCKGSWPIVNKFFNLCLRCNNERLHGNKHGKVNKPIKKDRKPFKPYPKRSKISSTLSDKAKKIIIADEELYEYIFNTTPHKCEECGDPLPDQFKDEDGKVIARWRYAHRFPKSTHIKFRHEIWNFVNLCLTCHQKYDFGKKKEMKVWKDSLKLLKKHEEI